MEHESTSELKKRLVDLDGEIESLLVKVDVLREQRAGIIGRLHYRAEQADAPSHRGSSRTDTILAAFEDGQVLTTSRIIAYLREAGDDASDNTIRATIGYLQKKGSIHRVKRGHYVRD